MKILFVSQYYPPETGAAANRIGYFARFLAHHGHRVQVLTSAPNYPEGKLYPGHKNRSSHTVEDGVAVHRARIFLTKKTNTVTRIAHYLSFIVSSLLAKRKLEKPDIIIATSPPLFVGLLGVILKKLWKTRLFLDIRDLWPQSIESVGAVKNRGLLRQAERLASYIYRNADHITVTSPGIQKGLPAAILSSRPSAITVIPNGAELELFHPNIRGSRIRAEWNIPKDAFIVLYAGNLGLAQAPETLLKAAAAMPKNNIVFLIVGAGVLLEKLQAEAKKRGLKNVIFTGNQPRATMPEFVAAADICIIPYKKADTFRNTLPSKMFDYMAGSKPIIINLKGEASELLEEAGCGLLAQEEDGEDLTQKILNLKNAPETALAMGVAGRAYVEKNYARDVLGSKLNATLVSS